VRRDKLAVVVVVTVVHPVGAVVVVAVVRRRGWERSWSYASEEVLEVRVGTVSSYRRLSSALVVVRGQGATSKQRHIPVSLYTTTDRPVLVEGGGGKRNPVSEGRWRC
jgi:hypothetical protein